MKKINLFTNWFDSPVRPQEFDFCFKQNLNLFDRVINLSGRPHFNEFFDVALRFPGDVNVIANLDIYFDQSIKLSRWITEDDVYCLTRWESDGAGNICRFQDKHYGHPGEWSQDAWIFTGTKATKINAEFSLGERGCDNHIAWLWNEAGLNIHNPSEDIKAIHLHTIDGEASMGRGKRVGDGKYIKVPIGKLKML